jgi:DinB family protein
MPDDLKITYATDADGVRHATIPEDTFAYAASFILEAARKSQDEIAAVVQEGHDAVLRNIAGLSDEQAQYKASPDDWSVLDTMAHIVTVKRITVALTTSLATGELPPGFGPHFEEESAQDGVTVLRFHGIGEAREAAESAHSDLLALIAHIDRADLSTRFRHYFFGALNAREWACFQRVHDGDHFPQLARIRETAGFPAA